MLIKIFRSSKLYLSLLILLVTCFCTQSLKIKEPNLIIFIIDTLRPDHLSCYGYDKIKTPHLDKLAEEGMIFTNAVCQVPMTLPSHCSIFTGRYPTAHGVRHNGLFKLDPGEITLAEVLRENNFETAAFVSSYVLDPYFGLTQGFQTYSAVKTKSKHKKSAEELIKETQPERIAEDVNQDFFKWLSSVKDKRFFAWVHYFDPHWPYNPPEQTEMKLEGEGYDREISYSDQCAGVLLKKLEEASLLDNSIILFCSDHGEGLGEHTENTHGVFIYDSCIKIPLIIRAPWMIKKGSVYKGLFETVDIMPTLLELLGLTVPSTVQGQSFAKNILNGKFLEGKSESYTETYMPTFEFGWSELKSIRKSGIKYIEAPIPEIYDLLKDPKELINLHIPSSEESLKLREDLKDLISRITPQGTDPYKFEEIDEEKVKMLKSLGYLSGDYFQHGEIDPNQERIDPKLTFYEANIHFKAMMLMEEGKFKEALVAFQDVLSKNPNNYQARIYTIKIHFSMEDYRSAEAEALKAIKIVELDPTATTAMGPILWHMYGYILEKKNEFEKAEGAYRKAFEMDPERSFFPLSNFYTSRKEFDKAIEIAKETLKVNPENVLVNSYLFNLFIEKKNIDEAIPIAKKLVYFDLSDDVKTLFLAGDLLKRKGMLPEAAIAFEQILSINPQDKEMLGNLGTIYYKMNAYANSIEKFEEVLQIDPKEVRAHFNLGAMALERNDEEEARRRFNTVLSLEPTYHLVHNVLGSWLKDRGRMDEAREEFKKALELNPEDQIALQGLKSIR